MRRWTGASVACALALGCASNSQPDLDANPPGESRSEERTRLRAEIEEDHTRLEAMITELRAEEAGPIYLDSEIEEIAERLTRHADRLEQLERGDRRFRLVPEPQNDDAADGDAP